MSSEITKANFLNLQKNQLHKTDDRYIPKAYKDVAAGMEKVFAQMMLEHMERTAPQENANDPAMQFYKSLELEQRADAMVAQNGVSGGVQRMILDQIYPQEMRTLENMRAFEAQEKARMPMKKAIAMYNQNQAQEALVKPVANAGIQEEFHE